MLKRLQITYNMDHYFDHRHGASAPRHTSLAFVPVLDVVSG